MFYNIFLYSYGFYLNNMSYPLKLLGNSILKLLLIFRNKHRFLCDFYFKNFISSTFLSNDIILYKNPVIFFGNSILLRKDSKHLF